jgi:hypothetical protein
MMFHENLDGKREATASSKETTLAIVEGGVAPAVETLDDNQRVIQTAVKSDNSLDDLSLASNTSYCDERVDDELQRTMTDGSGMSKNQQEISMMFHENLDGVREASTGSKEILDDNQRVSHTAVKSDNSLDNRSLASNTSYCDERVDDELQRTMTDCSGMSVVDEKDTFVFTMESDNDQEYTLPSFGSELFSVELVVSKETIDQKMVIKGVVSVDTINKNEKERYAVKRMNSVDTHSLASNMSYCDERLYNELQRTMTDYTGISESDDEQEYVLQSSGSESSIESEASGSVATAEGIIASSSIDVRLEAKILKHLYNMKIENDLRAMHNEACNNLKVSLYFLSQYILQRN